MIDDAQQQAPDNVHQQDHHARDRITAHKPARPVHRPEEISLPVNGVAAPVGLVLIDEPRVQIGIDRHLPSRAARPA